MLNFKFEKWEVAYRKHKENLEGNNNNFMLIRNPLRYWAADPFIIYDNGFYYIFAELYDRIKRKGEIGYCILTEDGKIGKKWKVIMKSNIHFSFPYIWKNGNEYYMMPESSKEEQLCIYKAINFPEEWEKIETIMTGVRFSDSVFVHSKHIMTYDNESEPKKLILIGKNNEGSYNIIREIVDNDLKYRPAGKGFYCAEKMIFPFQDGNGSYGKGINFLSVNVENDKLLLGANIEYSLYVESTNFWKYNYIGIHTYNYDQDYEVVDFRSRRFNFFSLFGLACEKIRFKRGYN